jgi:hypothetical protein
LGQGLLNRLFQNYFLYEPLSKDFPRNLQP